MARNVDGMFDKEVVDLMRKQFDELDTDRSGTISAEEACEMVAKTSVGNESSRAEIKRLASSLFNQMDADRSGTITFDEFCFRFGRKYQMEYARKRRAGEAWNPGSHDGDADRLRRQREEIQRERERIEQERREIEQERERLSGGKQGPETSKSSAPPVEGKLEPDAKVKIQGIQSAPELNGQVGTVLGFDSSKGRYVVELTGGVQKSLKRENLAEISRSSAPTSGGTTKPSAPSAPAGPSFSQRAEGWGRSARSAAMNAGAKLQVAFAGWESWQLVLGAAVILLFAYAYFDVTSRYGTKTPVRRPKATSFDSYDSPSPPPPSWREDEREYDRDYRQDAYSDHSYRDSYQDDRDRYQDRRHHRQQRQQYRRGYDNDYDDYDDYGGGGGGGLLSGMSQWQTMAICGFIGYLCWKDIIPVSRMSFFQLYMLWNMLSPMLFGGRRRGGYGMGYGGYGMGGMGGMGMGRRGFGMMGGFR